MLLRFFDCFDVQRLKTVFLSLVVSGLVGGVSSLAATPMDGFAKPLDRLPTGWRLTPAGKLIALTGDMPLKIAAAPDGRSMLVLTGGYHDQAINLIDPAKGALTQHMLLAKASAGLAVDGASHAIYVSGGSGDFPDLSKLPESASLSSAMMGAVHDPVLRLDWRDGQIEAGKPLPIAGLAEKDRFILSLAVDAEHHLYAVNTENDTLYKLDLADNHVLAQITLGYRPADVVISPDGKRVAVSNWGDKSVSLLDPASLAEKTRVAVGAHPLALAFSADGRLFVSNSGGNSVSVIEDGRILEQVTTSLAMGDPLGSTPNALAVSPDGRTLYVANADNNDLAVVDIHERGHAHIVGFIPTGWYPTALALTPDGRNLVVGVAKGVGSQANWPARPGHRSLPADRRDGNFAYEYIAQTMTGLAEIVPIPNAQELARYTRQVRGNVPVGASAVSSAERQEAEQAFSKIKHVIYIIRENRTYDSVLGDDPRGDGVKDLAYFGREVTPNVHALSEQGVLLDRYFVNGEVSVDGHNWANAAYVPSFVERDTAVFYGGRGGIVGDERLTDSPAGKVWDLAKRKGLSYYSYGEYWEDGDEPSQIPLIMRDATLRDHSSREWGKDAFAVDDVARAQFVVRDLKAAEKTGVWPNYVVIWLPWDHTLGFTPGKATPKAAVAMNDLALGMIVDAVSHSRFWSSTAIFSTEDDAQGGPDHVDDHRSVGLVASPYVAQGFVDHTPYTMTGMVRTMELILGLPAMTQHDRDATPMYRIFRAMPKLWQYNCVPESEDIKAVNPADGPLARQSARLDFSDVDRADPQALNALLWTALKPGEPMPVPVSSAYAGMVRTVNKREQRR
jgi:YVTN family beta-propeller protein